MYVYTPFLIDTMAYLLIALAIIHVKKHKAYLQETKNDIIMDLLWCPKTWNYCPDKTNQIAYHDSMRQ